MSEIAHYPSQRFWQLSEDPEGITRTKFKGLYTDEEQDLADKIFDDLVGEGESGLSRKRIGADKTTFSKKVEPIREIARQRIAHLLGFDKPMISSWTI
jgi:hypothetical protein